MGNNTYRGKYALPDTIDSNKLYYLKYIYLL